MANQPDRQQQEQDEYTWHLWTRKDEKHHREYREWLKRANDKVKERLRAGKDKRP